MKKVIYIAVAGLFLIGCKTKTVYLPSQTKFIEKTSIVHERDTTIQIEQDSSFYRAWIECQNNKPVLKNPILGKGSGKVKAPIVSLDSSGRLDVGCVTENIALRIKLKELETQINEKVTETVEVAKPLTFFQELFIKVGQIFCLYILFTIGQWAYLKFLKK
ncbi:hypothetical protein [Sphingobacterium siyangense]|uniref:hypothetical protein n=1 Tax=Sphingobacterium siyangense TaxID=459529 RepID=UPI00301762B4